MIILHHKLALSLKLAQNPKCEVELNGVKARFSLHKLEDEYRFGDSFADQQEGNVCQPHIYVSNAGTDP